MSIAFDNITESGVISGTTATFTSHSVTSTNPIAFLGIRTLTSNDSVTGASFNGTAMTLLHKDHFGAYGPTFFDNYIYFFMLQAPSSGAHTVSISQNISRNIVADFWTYSGTKQTTQPDVTDSTDVYNSTSPGWPAAHMTRPMNLANSNNAWFVGFGQCEDATGNSIISASTNDTMRSSTGNVQGVFDSNGIILPTSGSQINYTINTSLTSSNIMFTYVIIKPIPPTVTGGFLLYDLT